MNLWSAVNALNVTRSSLHREALTDTCSSVILRIHRQVFCEKTVQINSFQIPGLHCSSRSPLTN